MSARYVTHEGVTFYGDPTPADTQMEDPEAYRLYSLCPCEKCKGTGKTGFVGFDGVKLSRCKECRGEGRTLTLVATCGSKEAVGTALVTLAAEGHWDGDCPFGLMHRPEGEKGRWILKPWQASARNVSDAGRTLARSKNPVPPS